MSEIEADEIDEHTKAEKRRALTKRIVAILVKAALIVALVQIISYLFKLN